MVGVVNVDRRMHREKNVDFSVSEVSRALVHVVFERRFVGLVYGIINEMRD